MSIIGQSVLFARGCFDHLRGAGVVSVAGDLRIFETPDVSDLLFVCSNNHPGAARRPLFLHNACEHDFELEIALLEAVGWMVVRCAKVSRNKQSAAFIIERRI